MLAQRGVLAAEVTRWTQCSRRRWSATTPCSRRPRSRQAVVRGSLCPGAWNRSMATGGPPARASAKRSHAQHLTRNRLGPRCRASRGRHGDTTRVSAEGLRAQKLGRHRRAGKAVILPKDPAPTSSRFAGAERSLTPSIDCWLCGRPRARSTSCTSSSRRSPQTRGPADVLDSLFDCHPERSKPIREASRFAQSKDPYLFNIHTIFAGNSHYGA